MNDPWHATMRASPFALLALLAPLLLLPSGRLAAQPAEERAHKIADYILARQQFAAATEAYWTAIAKKRRIRNDKRRKQQDILTDDYVLTQPPVYSGPPRPPGIPADKAPLPPRKYVPVVADFLKSAAEHFRFVPERPRREADFKRAYARAAAAAGLTKGQIVGIYGFETGGNGSYDMQAGLGHRKAGAKAISPALGYNQLLATNTISILAEHGDRVVKTLEAKAARRRGPAQARLRGKISAVQRMIAFSRTVPFRWSELDKLAETQKGFGPHALNLDIDVGPLLQTRKLLDSVVFAKRKGFPRPLRAVELELMNFTGDGNGFDMVTMPQEMRSRVPTANFFQQRGYERNPVAGRTKVVAGLFAAINAKMQQMIGRRGAKEMAAAYPR